MMPQKQKPKQLCGTHSVHVQSTFIHSYIHTYIYIHIYLYPRPGVASREASVASTRHSHSPILQRGREIDDLVLVAGGPSVPVTSCRGSCHGSCRMSTVVVAWVGWVGGTKKTRLAPGGCRLVVRSFVSERVSRKRGLRGKLGKRGRGRGRLRC